MIAENLNSQLEIKFQKEDGSFAPLERESRVLFNGFSEGLSSGDNENQEVSVFLRVYNRGLSEATPALYMTMDFSESFLTNYSLKKGYYDLDGLDSSILITVSTGIPNQDRLQQEFSFSSDLKSLVNSSYIGMLFTSDLLIQQGFLNNPLLSSKMALYPYLPKLGEYVPLKITVKLGSDLGERLVQKPLISRFPVSFRSLCLGYASSQEKILGSLETAVINLLPNKSVFSRPFHATNPTNNTVSCDLYSHSLQFYADNHYFVSDPVDQTYDLYRDNAHVFSLHPTSVVGGIPEKFVLQVDQNSSAVLGVTYEGRTTQRPIHKVMFEVLGLLKLLVIYAKDENTEFSSYAEALKDLLLDLVSQSNPRVLCGYSSFSGSPLPEGGKVLYHIFFRSAYAILASLLESKLSEPIQRSIFENLPFHVHYSNHPNQYPSFKSLETVDSYTVYEYTEMAAACLMLFDLRKYLLKINPGLNQESVEALNLLQPVEVGVAAYLSEQMKFLPVFDPEKLPGLRNLKIPPEKLPFATVVAVLSGYSEFYPASQEFPSSVNFWNFINYHYKVKGVPTSSVPIITVSNYPTVDLSDGSSTVSDFIAVISDIDLVTLYLYKYLDTIFYQERSTTISFRMFWSTNV